MIRLVPLIELEPSSFQTDHIESPAAIGPDDPDAWRQYWLASLAQSGITELESFGPGNTWLVDVTTLTEPATLRTLISRRFATIDDIRDLDQHSAILGGIALELPGEAPILPQCCGDLGNLANYAACAELADGEQRMLWIGHPWLIARGDGDHIQLSDYTERNASDIPLDESLPYRVERQALRDAVDQAYTALAALRTRLEPHIAHHIAGHPIDHILDILLHDKRPAQ